MNQNYFEKWVEFAKKSQKPLVAIAELNVKTLQSLAKPEDLIQVKKPEELVDLTIKSGHQVLNYVQESFKIFETTLHSWIEDLKFTAQIKK